MEKAGFIGFIGLGIMGRPMAKNMLKAGQALMVYDLNPAAVKELTDCGAEAGSLKEIGENCRVIFMILPNGPIVQQVLFGGDGLAQWVKAGAVICDMSSVTPIESQTCYEKLKEMGIGFVDCPVSGGEPKAIDGTLAFMAGCDEEDYKTLEPYFSMMGSHALRLGGSGSGSVCKLANQIIVNMTIATVSEALVLATKAGADPSKVYEAIRGGLAGSTVLDAKAPMMFNRNFKPGGTLAINYKDINNVLTTAHAMEVPVPLSSQLFEILQALKVKGHMGDDHSGIVQYFEDLAGVKVEKKAG